MKPTATELIERIKQAIPHCTEGQDAGQLFYTTADKLDSFHCLLNTCIAHLSDPWIGVEERLPEYGRRMAIDFDDAGPNQFYTGWLCDDDVWYCEQLGVVIVTHWCPLPLLPQKAGEE